MPGIFQVQARVPMPGGSSHSNGVVDRDTGRILLYTYRDVQLTMVVKVYKLYTYRDVQLTMVVKVYKL